MTHEASRHYRLHMVYAPRWHMLSCQGYSPSDIAAQAGVDAGIVTRTLKNYRDKYGVASAEERARSKDDLIRYVPGLMRHERRLMAWVIYRYNNKLPTTVNAIAKVWGYSRADVQRFMQALAHKQYINSSFKRGAVPLLDIEGGPYIENEQYKYVLTGEGIKRYPEPMHSRGYGWRKPARDITSLDGRTWHFRPGQKE